MRPSCFPFLSHENTIEGNMLLQQPQLLKTRVNMSFEALPLLCKLTASGSTLILILYGKFNSRSYAAFLYSQIKKTIEWNMQLHVIAYWRHNKQSWFWRDDRSCRSVQSLIVSFCRNHEYDTDRF